MNSRLLIVPALCLAAAAARGNAQTLERVHRSGGYGSIGIGGGNFNLTCDSVCAGGQLGSSGGTLILGRHLSQRVRAEVGLRYQSNRDQASNVFGVSLGAAVYVVGNLHVRGAGTYQTASIEEATGTYSARGGPGFTVGAGYDLFVGSRAALTPYVSYTSGRVSKITISGGGTGQTSGSLTALHFGAALSFARGTYSCTTTAGETIVFSRSTRTRFLACLNEVERRLGRSTSFKR